MQSLVLLPLYREPLVYHRTLLVLLRWRACSDFGTSLTLGTGEKLNRSARDLLHVAVCGETKWAFRASVALSAMSATLGGAVQDSRSLLRFEQDRLRRVRAHNSQQDLLFQIIPQPEQVLTGRMMFETLLDNLNESAEESPFLVCRPTATMSPRNALAADDVIRVTVISPRSLNDIFEFIHTLSEIFLGVQIT